MSGRASPSDHEPGFSLPAFERSAPPPPPALVASRIELHSSAGDVVADLFGRGGWVARAAVDRQRRAISLESSPLTRVLADVVLRPPDVRHLDAAFQGMAASPRRESSLKVSLGDLYATRCATCARTLVIDEISWAVDPSAEPGSEAAEPRPVARHYRCTVCRDQRGGGEQRQAPLDEEDLVRLHADVGVDAVRAALRGRFPAVHGAEDLIDELLALHTPRQLVGLAAIIDRIESDLRAAPGPGGAPAGLPAHDPAREPPDARARPDRAAADRRRARQAAGVGRVARAQPVARLRGRGPPRPRLRPAAGGRRPRSAAGAPRRGPAQPGGGDRDRRPRAVEPVRPAAPPGRSHPEQPRPAGAAAPARAGPAPRPAQHGAAVRRVSRDRLGPRPRRRGPAADRRPERDVAAAAVELAGGDHRPLPRGDDPGHGPRRAGGLPRGRRSRGARRGRPRRGRRGLPAGQRAAGRRRRRHRRLGRVPAAGLRPPARAADPGQRVAPGGAGRLRRPGPRPRPRPVLRAGAVRPAAVLARGGGAHRDRGRGRDAARPRRARPLRAAARRGAGRPGPCRPAAPARDARARTRRATSARPRRRRRSRTRRRRPDPRRRPARSARRGRRRLLDRRPEPAGRPRRARRRRPAERAGRHAADRRPPGSPRPTRSTGSSRWSATR